jgi:hypothetical protein
LYVDKKIVLLLVENGPLDRLFGKFFIPVFTGAALGSAYTLGSNYSADLHNRQMYHDACEVAKANGESAPDPKNFQRQNSGYDVEINAREGTFKATKRK